MKIGTDIHHAGERLKQGKLVAFPTETVFGLGGDATSSDAVAAIFTAKNRPDFNPLIIHVSDIAQAKTLVEWNETAEKLSQALWPGALTLVLKRSEDCPISLLASAGLDTLAIRVPNHPVAQALLSESGVPIAAPSANISGRVSATTAAHVAEDFAGQDIYVIDAEAAELGIESAVVYALDDKAILLRVGAIEARKIEDALGVKLVRDTHATSPQSPGQLLKHYAPHKKLRLNATHVDSDEALLAFGADVPQGSRVLMNLSENGDLQEAAANLFATLRALDATDARAIAAMPIPMHGLGEAINDRLQRAASSD